MKSTEPGNIQICQYNFFGSHSVSVEELEHFDYKNKKHTEFMICGNINKDIGGVIYMVGRQLKEENKS